MTNSKSSISNTNINNEPVIPSSGSQKQSSDNIDKNNFLSTNKNNIKDNSDKVKAEPSTTQTGAPKHNNSIFPEGLMQN